MRHKGGQGQLQTGVAPLGCTAWQTHGAWWAGWKSRGLASACPPKCNAQNRLPVERGHVTYTNHTTVQVVKQVGIGLLQGQRLCRAEAVQTRRVLP